MLSTPPTLLIVGAAGIVESREIVEAAAVPRLPEVSVATIDNVLGTSVPPTLSDKPAPMLPDTSVVPAAGAAVLTDHAPTADAVVS